MMEEKEIFEALNAEHDLYDPQENILYVLDRNDEGKTYGVQEVHITPKGPELVKILRDYAEEWKIELPSVMMQWSFGCIPAPGCCCGNEYGYIDWCGFDTLPDDASDEDIERIGEQEISWYAKSLVEEGIAERLVVDTDIPELLGL